MAAGSVVGVVVSLAAGLFVAGSLNASLAIDWVREVASLGVGVVVAAAMLRGVAQTAQGRWRAMRGSAERER